MIGATEIEAAADVLQEHLAPRRTRDYCVDLARKVLEAATKARYQDNYRKAFDK